MSDSRHIMLAIGVFLGVLLLGGMTLVAPNAREVGDIRDRIADLQFRSEGVEHTTAMVEQLSAMMAEARRTIDSELKSIPAESGIAPMIRRLSLPIDNVTVQDQTFNVGTMFEPLPETHPAIRAVPVTMEMKATFDAVYAVLRSIETMDRLVRLRTIRIRAADDRTNRLGEPMIEAVMVIEAVYGNEVSIPRW